MKQKQEHGAAGAGIVSGQRRKWWTRTYNESIWKYCNGSYQLDKVPCKGTNTIEPQEFIRVCCSILSAQTYDMRRQQQVAAIGCCMAPEAASLRCTGKSMIATFQPDFSGI